MFRSGRRATEADNPFSGESGRRDIETSPLFLPHNLHGTAPWSGTLVMRPRRHLYLIRQTLPAAIAVKSSSAKCRSKKLNSPEHHRLVCSNDSTSFEIEAGKAFGLKYGG
jgi:hypothetical protein